MSLPALVLPAAARLVERHRSPIDAKPRLSSQELFKGANELIIEHRGEEYRLKLTRNDKLILNK